MVISNFIKGVIKHFHDNFWLCMVIILCLCTGIVLGTYTVKFMDDLSKSDLNNYFQNFTQRLVVDNINYNNVFVQAIKNNIPILLAIWFLGLTIVGIPIILILLGIKGFSIGFSASFLIRALGLKGVWVILIGLLPQNIIYVPCLVWLSVLSIKFSLEVFNERNEKRWTNSIWVRIASFSLFFLIGCIIMFVGLLVETYLTPNLVKIILIGIK